ncbi:ATP-dependent helicase [Cutibacterium acnes JCM 18909]|nr:ATP-dependent helicase [Cutibacterium acnes JCM 18909]
MNADPTPEVDHADLVAPLLSLAVWGSPRGEGWHCQHHCHRIR